MSPAEAKSIAGMLLGGLESEYAITLKVLAAVPENQLEFKLGDKGRTARELAWHLAASEVWFAKAIITGDFSYEETPIPPEATTADIVAFYQKEIPAAFESIKALSGEQLAKEVNMFGVMNMPDVLYMNFWSSHSIHHRGQLSTYLRAMNAHVPSIYGGSADEPFQMPATA